MIRSFCNTNSFITAATSLISTVIVQWRTSGECPPPPETSLFYYSFKTLDLAQRWTVYCDLAHCAHWLVKN